MDDRRAHVPKSQGNHVERHARFQIVCRRLWDETRFLKNLGSSATARVVDFHPEVGTSVHLTAETMSRSASSNETDPAGPGRTDNDVKPGQHQSLLLLLKNRRAVRPAFFKRRYVLASAPLNLGKSQHIVPCDCLVLCLAQASQIAKCLHIFIDAGRWRKGKVAAEEDVIESCQLAQPLDGLVISATLARETWL